MDRASSANVHTYWIDSSKATCSGVAPHQCLRVKKGIDFDATDWGNFFSPIEGFDYEPGSIYQLLVKETKREAGTTPADASSIIYTLVEVVKKTPDTKLRLHDIWALEAVDGKEIDFSNEAIASAHPTIEFNLSEMRMMGMDGCNSFHGAIETVGNSSLHFGSIMSTLMACSGNETFDKISPALGKVTAYRIKGLKLELLDETGIVLLRYRKVD